MNKTLIFLFTFSYIFLTSCGDSTTTTNIDNSINEIAQISQTTFNVSGRSIDIEFDGKHFWVAHYEDGTISKIDLDGKTIGTFEVAPEPIKIKHDGDFIWIAHFTKPIITKMKLDGSIVGEFPTGESPGGMIIKDDFLWVANGMSDFLSKVERQTGKTLETFKVGGTEMPGPFALEFDGENIWVANYFENSIDRLNLKGELLQTIQPGIDPVSMAFDGEHLWVVLVDEDSVAKINPKDGDIESFHLVPKGPREIIFDNQNLWVISFDDKILTKMDLEGNLIGEFSVGGGPWSITTDNENIWVVDSTQNIIHKIGPINSKMPEPKVRIKDTVDFETIKSLPKILLSENGVWTSPVPFVMINQNLWVSIPEENRIVRITPEGKEDLSVPLEGNAASIAFDGKFLWVTNPQERSILQFTQDGEYVEEFEVSTRPTKIIFVGLM